MCFLCWVEKLRLRGCRYATQMRKANCTPDEWANYLQQCKAYRLANIDSERQRLRDYNQRPEVKARRRAHDAKPEIRLKRLLNGQTDSAKKAATVRHKQRMADNPEIWAAKLAEQRRNRTGFTPELFAAALAKQNGCCAVCLRELGTTHRACADHCHDTRKPRGILCHHCNILEGMLRGAALTPKQWAERMDNYLSNPPAQATE